MSDTNNKQILKDAGGASPVILSGETYRQIQSALNRINTGSRNGSMPSYQGDGAVIQRASNATDQVIPFGTIVEFTDPIPTTGTGPYEHQSKFEFKPAEDPIQDKSIGITLEAVPGGKYGRIVIYGMATLKGAAVTNANHKYMGISGSGAMESQQDPTAIKIMHADGTGTLDQMKVFLGAGGGGGGGGLMIPVDMVRVGGTQGTGTTKPSWTYDVYLAQERGNSPQPILSGVDPTTNPHQWVRHLGQMTEADFGIAWQNPSDQWELTWINEQTIAAECKDDTGTPPGTGTGTTTMTVDTLANKVKALEARVQQLETQGTTPHGNPNGP